MDKVLTRPIFKNKYLKSITKKVSTFNEGGLASLKNKLEQYAPKGEFLAYINKDEAELLKAFGGSGKVIKETGIPSFDTDASIGGGNTLNTPVNPAVSAQLLANKDIYPVFSSGERTAMILSPIISKLLEGQQNPGQSQFGALASNIGKGVEAVPTVQMELAKMEGTRLNSIAQLAKTNNTFQNAIAKADADHYQASGDQRASAYSDLNNLNLLDKILQNPNLKIGTFGELSTDLQKAMTSLGYKGGDIQDLTGAQLLKTNGGQMALAGLRDLKGSISDKEGAWLKGMNPSANMTKEQVQAIIETRRALANRDIDYANKMDNWVNTYGDLRTPTKEGTTWQQYQQDYLKNHPAINSDTLKKIDNLSSVGYGSGVGSGLNASIITGKDNKQYLRTLDSNGKPVFTPYTGR